MQRNELKALTSLRGIAAVAIVLQHFSTTAAGLTDAWIPSLVPHGYMAVDFFFVLSGFIMAYTYLADFERDGLAAYRPFLLKRVARIFPLGVAVTALILACAAIASLWGRIELFIPTVTLQHDLALVTLVNMAHLQGVFPGFTLNAPSWSVSLELGAYLMFPLLLRLCFCRRKRGAGLTVALGIATLAVAEWLAPRSFSSRAPIWDATRCLVEFGLGLMAFRAFRTSSTLQALGQDRWTLSIAILTALSGVLRLDLLTALCFPPLVLAFALNRGYAERALSARAPHYLGVISFSIYLTHNLFRAPLAAIVSGLHPTPLLPQVALMAAAAGSLLVLPVAALSYRFVERPGRIAVNRILGSWKQPRQFAAAN